jgi:hypothetical protein
MLMVVAAVLAVSTLIVAVRYLRGSPRDEVVRFHKRMALVNRVSGAGESVPGVEWARPGAVVVPKPRDAESETPTGSPG